MWWRLSNEKMNTLLFLSFVPLLTKFAETANILYVIPFSSVSHYILLRPVGLELARRGHNVTVITSNKEVDPPPNYQQVMVDDKKIWDLLGGERPNVFTMVDMSAEEFHKNILWAGGLAFTELTLNSTDVKEFYKKDNEFDLVISEQFFQEALYTLAYKYNAPLALITTFGNCMRHNIVYRNPLQLATVVPEFLDLKDPSSYWGRLRNLYFMAYEYFWWRFWYLNKQEQLVHKYLPDIADKVPSLYALQRNVSLMMINSHFSFDVPAALLPNVVEVGGVHLSRSNTSLPADLQKLLDESENGVVYINFGSNVRSAELPQNKKEAFLNVFKCLKYTILWKWEDDQLDNKPSNIVIRKWLPQKEILGKKVPSQSQESIIASLLSMGFLLEAFIPYSTTLALYGLSDITQLHKLHGLTSRYAVFLTMFPFIFIQPISDRHTIRKLGGLIFGNTTFRLRKRLTTRLSAHPNIKAFVTHGGLIGTQEAIFNGVPLLGIPIYADQYNNLLLGEQAGFAKILLYHDITEKTLYKYLNEILNNNSYSVNAKEISRLFKDRPMTALDTAVYWVEYVIRNKGAEYMKNPARNMSWIAYNMVDVYISILILFIIVIVIFVKTIRLIINVSSVNKVEIKNKKKRS